MVNDRSGTPISTGLVYVFAGECRQISGSKIVLVGGTRSIVCDAADIAQIDALGGGGAGEANTGSNVGASGVGTFDAKVGVDLQFRKIDAASSKVTTALNGQKIDVDVVPANFTGIPQSGVTNLTTDLAGKEAAGTAAGLIATHEAAADPHTGYQKESEKGAVNGYASLDGSGTVPDAQIPASIARDSEITSAISTHEGAADPHTGYQKESEKGAASGYASLDAGTLVPVAQLATGTPDGTKYLRDDRTWQTVSGGSGLTHAQTMSRVALRC